jgi:hypothetical protein
VSVRACGFESRSGHFTPTRVAKLVDAQSSGGCAFGRAGSSPVPGTMKALGNPRLFLCTLRLLARLRDLSSFNGGISLFSQRIFELW